MIPQRHGLQDLQAIVLGRAGMDLYPVPRGTKTMDADTFNADLGGSAGNIAVALARRGLTVGLTAPVSDDPVGRFVAQKLGYYGVEHLTPRPVTGAARTSLVIMLARLLRAFSRQRQRQSRLSNALKSSSLRVAYRQAR